MELNWKKNLSDTDRIIRVVIGFILLGLIYTKIVSGWLGVIAIVVALSQFVEAYFSY
ncbi:DUF2892 domain-containing protein [Phosphitispora sp. TUW77]|uniref:YgaP family membrane protein n=1 Tax=Phosphitispora sp. TUW77 TaxID=3152361 RepID=UPI003AB6663D